MGESEFHTVSINPNRALMVDAGYLANNRHIMHGLVEADVTKAKRLRNEIEESGSGKLSFTAYMVACIARAVAKHPEMQGYRNCWGKLIIFHDVDVVTMIEPGENKRKGGGGRMAIPHIIRQANRRSVRQISDEIRTVQCKPRTSKQHAGTLAYIVPKLPRWLRLLLFSLIKLNPHRLRELQGTVVLSSLGMFISGGGWGITFLSSHTAGITIGGIVEKTAVVEGEISVRNFINLTLSFDHDVVDGAPAARFVKTLVNLVESASLLEEELEKVQDSKLPASLA